jgi:diguanylate cyclase (GGDEF)-like protein
MALPAGDPPVGKPRSRSARESERAPGLISAIVQTRAHWLAFIGIWVVGLVGLAAVIRFEVRVDTERHAEVVVEVMERQVGDFVGVAFNPALASGGSGPTVENTAALAASKQQILNSLASLSHLGAKSEQLRIDALTKRYFAGTEHLAALVAGGHSRLAAIEYGRQKQPTGAFGALFAELKLASAEFSTNARHARVVGAIGTIVAVLFMLIAFSLALYRAIRLAREKHELLERSRIEALTDSLTGLANRRKLFLDTESLLHEPSPDQLWLGMYDLDGFKAYNDAFGHPAGDALLARIGHRLAATVDGHGTAYRIGGDEFCVIVRGADGEQVLAGAAEALSEHGPLFDVTCSRGSLVIAPSDMTFEQAIQQADQRLYDEKRAQAVGGQPRDVLLSVLAEQNQKLAAHMLSVGRLATAVAEQLGLSRIEIARTCLAAELHDIGKTAIPDSILDKQGPLDDAEWAFIRRHTIIGERILAATASLADVAPVVRWSHERHDGSGYPDGLRADQIPLSSRIVAVVDAYDAMTTERSYSRARSHADAIAEIRRCIGSQFDPIAAEALIVVSGDQDAESRFRAPGAPVVSV